MKRNLHFSLLFTALRIKRFIDVDLRCLGAAGLGVCSSPDTVAIGSFLRNSQPHLLLHGVSSCVSTLAAFQVELYFKTIFAIIKEFLCSLLEVDSPNFKKEAQDKKTYVDGPVGGGLLHTFNIWK